MKLLIVSPSKNENKRNAIAYILNAMESRSSCTDAERCTWTCMVMQRFVLACTLSLCTEDVKRTSLLGSRNFTVRMGRTKKERFVERADTWFCVRLGKTFLCDGNPFIFICKHHKQDATFQESHVSSHRQKLTQFLTILCTVYGSRAAWRKGLG
jgi:hypothetical protein